MFMKKVIIGFKKKPKKARRLNLFPKTSKEADYFLLKISILLNLINRLDPKVKKQIYPNGANIVYLPISYVEFLHDFIIDLYKKSDDPIVSGYMSRDNLDYTIDPVKYLYNRSC